MRTERWSVSQFIGWLLNVPATCLCISGSNLLRNCTCYHTELKVADKTCHLTHSLYIVTGPPILSTSLAWWLRRPPAELQTRRSIRICVGIVPGRAIPVTKELVCLFVGCITRQLPLSDMLPSKKLLSRPVTVECQSFVTGPTSLSSHPMKPGIW